MRFREELVLNIQAPREVVWAAFQDFSSWPTWARAIKEVSRVGSGWRFKARGQPPVDLVWVAEATERRPPEYLAFRSVPGVPHNLEISGWVRLDEAPDGSTHLELLFEGHPHYSSPLLDRAADWYAAVFGEPNKLLKVTFEQFKAHLEKSHHQPELSTAMT
ncbi:MAG: SRPBCC family protein [Meiothermus sp.]|uniref:SRPBCC family protein n=1 Tax=Meiothermus sp. TaxID=1955249 RepID=UPI0025D3793C|nr:SRPBCC family protein [Meiothermus sp.]MCS7067467.1 SRPBCC family protein [Meiothermus sp.]MCX7600528.1 SRPBCC family protein [Meiothermus sp.]MDW8425417.1 SRPBCC family protein [Meiothermus sp.]